MRNFNHLLLTAICGSLLALASCGAVGVGAYETFGQENAGHGEGGNGGGD